LRRPYGTPARSRWAAYPTLKRGANLRCAYGAEDRHTKGERVGMKTTEKQKKVLERLDEALLPFRVARKTGTEVEGWLRAVRHAEGVPVEEVARRLGVCRREIFRLENAEKESRIALRSLRHAAEALGCELVYALAPREGTLSEIARVESEGRKKDRTEKAQAQVKRPGWCAVIRKTLRKLMREVGLKIQKKRTEEKEESEWRKRWNSIARD
jgi:predicted DNA-binding mobile mystery protein A